MPTTIRMPQLGETVADGTVLRWAKQVGDTVGEGDVLLEIATDKVDTEVPSPTAGTIIELLVAEGETVDVGAPIAIISGGEEEQSTSTAPASAPEPAATPSPVTASPSSPVVPALPPGERLSPVVRRLAAEHDLDLSDMEGTGRDGRITKADVLAVLEAPALVLAPTPDVEPTPAPVASAARNTIDRGEVLTPAVARLLSEQGLRPGDVPATGTGGRLTRADVEDFLANPPVSTPATTPDTAPAPAAAPAGARGFAEVEVDFERIERLRGGRPGLSVLPFVARAALDAIRNIDGIDGPLGCVVGAEESIAVVPDAGDLRLEGLARRLESLEPTEGTAGLVLAHPGALGSSRSIPVLDTSAPVLVIDAVGRRPTVVTGPTGEESLAIRSIGHVGLVWTGGTLTSTSALALLQRVRENLESWAWEQELT